VKAAETSDDELPITGSMRTARFHRLAVGRSPPFSIMDREMRMEFDLTMGQIAVRLPPAHAHLLKLLCWRVDGLVDTLQATIGLQDD